MLAPVIIFVYNRPNHTRKTIESLAKNNLAKETEVFVYIDGPKDEISYQRVKLVKEYIYSLKSQSLFKSIIIEESSQNKGLANSVISGVNKIISEYGKVIVVEDDLVSSIDFLEYMNDALSYYDMNKSIWSISGYTFNVNYFEKYKRNIYYSFRGSSWGWATWKNRWEQVDWVVKDYESFKNNRILRKSFDRGGRDLSLMLDDQMDGLINSWAIRWCYTQSKLKMYSIYPVKSRIMNIGLDGTGTHGGITSHYSAILNDGIDPCEFDNLGLDNKMTKQFRNHFLTYKKYVIMLMKRKIKKILKAIGRE